MKKFKRLIIKTKNGIFLDNEKINVNPEIKDYYLDLVIAKLKLNGYCFQTIELKSNTNNSINGLLVEEDKFMKIKKEIYLFTKIACTTDMIDNFNIVDFNNIDDTLNYSLKLQNKFKEYHLIKKNNFSGYSVYLTFDEYNEEELIKEYSKKLK